MEPYRKTYKPFAWWLLSLAAGLLALALPGWQYLPDQVTRLTVLALLLWLPGLFVLIEWGGYAYWINGVPTFEQAQAAGAARRRLRQSP